MPMPEPLQLWDTVAEDCLTVVRALTDEDWERPTALPGWSVADVVAHLAHLEGVAGGLPQPEGGEHDPGAPGQTNGPIAREVTEAGVVARRGRSREDVVAELEQGCAARRDALADLDVSDLGAPAPGLAGRLGWDLRTWLRNRPIDLWVHEMDLRRALGRPPETGSPGAAHVAALLDLAYPFALRKQPAGTTVRAQISGPQGRTLAARVGEDGRAAPVADADEAATDGAGAGVDVTLTMDDATWLVLGCGRATPDEVDVAVDGDPGVAHEVLGRLNVMP